MAFSSFNSIHSVAGGGKLVVNPPTGLAVQSINDTTATITFTPPSGTITSYLATLNTGTTFPSTSSPISITGLTAGTSYTVTIQSIKSGVYSAPSSSLNITTQMSFGTSSLVLYLPMNNNLLNYASGTGASWAPSATGVNFSNSITAPANLGRYYLNNNSTYVNLNNSITIPSSGFTISLWVYPYTQTNVTYDPIFYFGTSDNNQRLCVWLEFTGLSSTQFRVNFTYKYSVNVDELPGNTYSTSAWYHIVYAISSSGYCTGYINGSNILSKDSFSYPGVTSASNQFFNAAYIGGHTLNAGLSEFRIYNKVLSQTQVNTLYNSGNGNLYPGI